MACGEAPAVWGNGWPETNNRKVRTMKTCINKLLKDKIAKWSLPALVIAVVALSIAWSNGGHRRYQLGGGWIGSGGAGIWNALQIPLDPEGRTAALRVSSGTLSPQLAGLFAALGATAGGSDNVGEMEMISHDTARFGTLGYGRMEVPGNPLQINSIFVMTGTLKFTGRDTIEVTYTINVYPVNVPGLPNADENGDGFPDLGAQPIVIPGSLPIQGVDIGKRVTLR